MFQYAKLMAFPFGKVIVKETDIKGVENVSKVRRVGGMIANILWLPFGICFFLASIVEIIGLAITIIGIPVAIVIAKSGKFLIWLIGAKVIIQAEAQNIQIQRSVNAGVQNAMQNNNVAAAPQLAVVFGIILAVAGIVYQYLDWKKKGNSGAATTAQAVPVQMVPV